ncbi:prepilin signal peptidase PulO-like peptidase [Xenococcus sp. PCC 7305]|uniref:prepilin peptidase n=1 Tax=Xenococcus sp. PCC 7305 TaxID=102125 RepID=UPI0002ACEDE8|nr:A24 family peptidase [Xenococcus sp. PCC 7305]ELS00959.1 prepilin signal peptidase PulO-like peptidase [Xenococcus sp. PCC 7305]
METLVSAIANTFVFIVGACIGSFLNVVVYRIPAGLSLIHPPSRCPQCQHRLGKTENVPILGWLWLRGRCRWCKTAISPRYPIVEFVTGLLFLIVFWRFGYTIQTIGYAMFLSWLLSLSLIDLDTMTLPASLTKSGLLVGLAFQVIVGWHDGGNIAGIAQQLMLGIGGAVLGIWLLETIRIVGSLVLQQEAMGDGDSKLMATIGAWLGWKLVLVSSFLACASGAIIGGGAMLFGILGRKQAMPFGPFLALGGAIALFYGHEIVTSYINLLVIP